MSEVKVYPVPAEAAAHAWINDAQYQEMYKRSVDDPEGFWAEQAGKFVTWFKPWDKVLDWDFTKGHIRWFEGATLNVSYNCLDRHLATRGDQVAIIWVGDSPNEARKVTYKQLHTHGCKFANVLKGLGVKKGDRICIYMPMIPETAVAMLACTRIGAIHSIVFGGFSPESLKDRILDVWGGYSHYLRRIKSSVYLSGRYNYRRVSRRPLVAPDYNPALHDQDALLVGGGLYREKFYTANMIYGFGTREYLATGYKAEVTTGYSWGEFNDALYLGASYETGGFRGLGYIMGGFTLGSYIDLENGMWQRSAVDVDLRWFSNLFLFKRSRIRQFLAFNYTQGWNRATGSDESIRFTRTDGLQALKEYIIGTNRMILNTETVVFTPYQPLGFRIAVFGFADFGLIGYSPNIFKNDFFTSFGLGVRLRNERLVFNTIQIRLGVAFGKRGLVESEYFRLSNPTRMEQYRYRPTRPEIVEFK